MAIKDILKETQQRGDRVSSSGPSWLSGGGSSRESARDQIAKAKTVDPWAVDTSHIKTDTEAQEALDMTRGQAASLLTNAPDDALSAYEERQLGKIEEKGFKESFLSGLQGFTEFIDRPCALVALAIRDLADIPNVASGGEKTFGVDAYIDTVLGKRERLVEKYGADLVGERGDISGSVLLDEAWSSDDDDPYWDKLLRGVASFGTDVLLDPITYVSFGAGGMAAKAVEASVTKTFVTARNLSLKRALAGTSDDVLETALERSMRLDIVKEGDEIFERLKVKRAEDAAEIGATDQVMTVVTPDEVLRKQAYEEAAGKRWQLAEDVDKKMFDKIYGDMAVDEVGIHGGTIGEKYHDVLDAVTNRNFGTLKRQHKDYIDHVFTSRNVPERMVGGEVVNLTGPGYHNRLGDAFTTGGMRIGNAFSPRMTSRPLKITQGAFEDWAPLKYLHKIPKSKLGKATRRAMPFVDNEAVGLNIARRILDEQNNPNRMSFADYSWVERQMLHTGQQLKNDNSMFKAYNATVKMNEIARKAGHDVDEIYTELYPSIQRGVVSPNVTVEKYGEELVQQFGTAMEAINQTMADSYNVLKRYVPGMGRIENYIPIVFDKKFQRALRKIEQTIGAPFSGDDLEAAAAKFSKALDGEEISVEEMTLFMEAYTSLVAVHNGKTLLGSAAPVRRRQLGQYLATADTTSRSAVLFDLQPRSSRTFVDQAEMSNSLSKVLRAIVKDKDVGVKWGDDASAFVTDPVALLQNYTAEVTAVAQQRVFLNAAKAVGAVRRQGRTVDVDRLLFALDDEFFDVNRGVVQRAVENREEYVQNVLKAPVKERTISLGGENSITVAAEIADSKPIQALVGKLRKYVRDIGVQQAQYQKRLRAAVQRNVNKGLPLEHAKAIAAADIPQLRTLRREWTEAVEAAYDDLMRDAQRVWFETSRDGQYYDEMIQGARDHVSWLKRKQKAVFDDVEDRYLRQMDADWERFPMKEQLSEGVLSFENQVQYEAVMAHVLDPVRKAMEERQAGLVKWLEEQIDELTAQRQGILEELDDYTLKISEGASKNQEYQARKIAHLDALGSELELKHDVYEAILAARAVDDDAALIAREIARTKSDMIAAEYVADTWNEIVEAGIARRRQLGVKQGPSNPAVRNRKGGPQWKSEMANRVEKIWVGTGDPNVPMIDWDPKDWGFYGRAKFGNGGLGGAELDTPWFWQIVADGVEDDWETWARMFNDPFFAGEDAAEVGATFISKAEITDHLSTRINKLEDSIKDLTEFRETWKHNKDLPPTSPQRRTYPKNTKYLRTAYPVSAKHDLIAEPLLAMHEHLDKLKTDLGGVLNGDMEITREYIIEHMSGRFRGIVADADYRATKATRNMKIGDSLVVAERAFRDLASAARETISPNRLSKAVEIVNAQLAELPGSLRLRLTSDNQIAVIQGGGKWKRATIPDLEYLVNGVRSGSVTTEQLESLGVGYVTAITEIDGALELVCRTAASMSAPTIAKKAQLKRSYEAFEDFTKLVDDIMQGRKTAESLRRWAYDGRRLAGLCLSRSSLPTCLLCSRRPTGTDPSPDR